MFYQNILKDASPYYVNTGILSGFGEHRHADIEIHYCLKGSFEVVLEKKPHVVNEGDLVLIGSMVSHEFPTIIDKKRKILTIIVGVSFLKKYFTPFCELALTSPIFTLSKTSEENGKLIELLSETASICDAKERRNELMIQGNLYKICSYLIDMASAANPMREQDNRDIKKVANIDKALELIYYNYADPLTVDDAALASGYGKSNFCKIFKNIVGDTFHNVLNRQRVDTSCGLLSETNLPVSEIALQVGFGDAKTFCRVFKEIKGITPGTYRKQRK